MNRLFLMLAVAGAMSLASCKGGENKEGEGKDSTKKEMSTPENSTPAPADTAKTTAPKQ